jgi:phosphatidylethanolamine N-methyltransferase
MVRHYLKNYFYPEDGLTAIADAFENWKQMYTLSLSMTYGAL